MTPWIKSSVEPMRGGNVWIRYYQRSPDVYAYITTAPAGAFGDPEIKEQADLDVYDRRIGDMFHPALKIRVWADEATELEPAGMLPLPFVERVKKLADDFVAGQLMALKKE